MPGAYCKFCARRCFVLRVIPDGPEKGWSGHLATCHSGMELDREKTGHDHTTAVNPITNPERAREIALEVGRARGWFHVTHEYSDAPDGAVIEWPEFGPGLWERSGNRWYPLEDPRTSPTDCAKCGTSDWACLDGVNTPVGRRCCGWCGIAPVHDGLPLVPTFTLEVSA